MNRFTTSKTLIVFLMILISGMGLEAQEAKEQMVDEIGLEEVRLEDGSLNTEWLSKAVIYEVNVRQYTEEGTFDAFAEHLPRLQKMGVDIIWLMPIHPISQEKRKGTLGSYYAVADYKAVNPEHGTKDDFSELVDAAHEMGMLVILDWVGNHTGWDNQWIKSNPGFYSTNEKGHMHAPVEDWSDVAALDFENPRMRSSMQEAMKYWVERFDIDGFRCDVAGMVPTDFWEETTDQLKEIKDVFMLAEAEKPEHHRSAFDMSYAWELHHIMNNIAKGEKNAKDLTEYLNKDGKTYKPDAYRMIFTSNHDENSWNGTVEERLGEAKEMMAVLSFTLPGMPLIYSGQETGLNHRLKFFEKDQIKWEQRHPMHKFYEQLVQIKTDNPAFWGGEKGGSMVKLQTNDDETLFAFARNNGRNTAVVVFNFTDKEQSVSLRGFEKTEEGFTQAIGSSKQVLSGKMLLEPWGYHVFVKNNK